MKPKSKEEQLLRAGLEWRLKEFRELAASRNIKTVEQREALTLCIRLIETMLGLPLTERAPTHHV